MFWDNVVSFSESVYASASEAVSGIGDGLSNIYGSLGNAAVEFWWEINNILRWIASAPYLIAAGFIMIMLVMIRMAMECYKLYDEAAESIKAFRAEERNTLEGVIITRPEECCA